MFSLKSLFVACILLSPLFVTTFGDGNLPPPIPPPPPNQFIFTANPKTETHCLALNIYYEARGELYAGRVAVANVTLNRTEHGEFPRTICGVIYQPGQFTWTESTVKNPYSWYLSLRLARKVLANRVDNTNGSTHFHLISINPDWSNLDKTVMIGHHIFFKLKEPVALARN